MAARAGMVNLIQELRTWTETAASDYSVAGVSYWTDDHLQEALDRRRRNIFREPLGIEAVLVGGSAEYYDYYWQHPYVEEAAGGSAVWEVEDSTGATQGTANYTINPQARHIRFNANTRGTAYFLTYRSYDLHRAASEIWRRKAAHVASRYSVRTDNHDLNLGEIRKAYLEMAAHYEGSAPAYVVQVQRGDTNW